MATNYYSNTMSQKSEEKTMPTSNTSYSRSQANATVTADDVSSINDAVFEILPENIPNTIITKAPEERFKLGTFTVICLVVNRVIGMDHIIPSIDNINSFTRNWYFQFSINCHQRNTKCWCYIIILVCWLSIRNMWSSHGHRIWPDHPEIFH
jgi:hypothetical protein